MWTLAKLLPGKAGKVVKVLDRMRKHIGGSDDGNYKETEQGADPVPELPSFILFAVGLLALAGYVLLERRKVK